MTYCVGLRLNEGLVMLSDTRTNAGIDNISRFRKMFAWENPGERAVSLMTAGNLSVTQGVITHLETALKAAAAGEEVETILNAASMYRVAQLVGAAMRSQQNEHRSALMSQGASADASVIVGGQRRGGNPRLFLVYSPGNFIEATDDTTYLQIGDHQYGKPILDRVITPETPLRRALKAAFVSMDSTLRSNLSVGMPLDLTVIKTGEYRLSTSRRIEIDDPYFSAVSQQWASALREAFRSLPEVE